MLKSLGRRAAELAAKSPWTNVYGLARSLLALSTLGTLAFSSSTVLFHPVQGLPPSPYCSHLACISLFCLVSKGHLEAARWIAVTILALIASGWRPRWTAIPHWWVAFSLQASISIPDGGDQLNALLALLLLPVALMDNRRSHWSAPAGSGLPAGSLAVLKRVTAYLVFLLIRLQVALVYFDSSVSKLRVEEWANGTALYYWLNYAIFGVPNWLKAFISVFVKKPAGVALLTWGTLMLELALAAGLILPRHIRRYLLWAGILFHASIATLMGLISFSITMIGALLLFLRSVDEPLRLPMPWTMSDRQGTPPIDSQGFNTESTAAG